MINGFVFFIFAIIVPLAAPDQTGFALRPNGAGVARVALGAGGASRTGIAFNIYGFWIFKALVIRP